MKDYRAVFQKLLDNKDNVFFIHYSCENLNDSNDGVTPRVTSIAILNLGSNQAKSFSIHLSSEILNIQKDEIKNHYEDLEKDLLEQFNVFVKENKDSSYWIHWNMHDITFGFAHLEHRYKVLTKNGMCLIPAKNRFDLSELLKFKYGKNYISHPRLEKLLELNDDKSRDFLNGRQEVEAFQHGEYVKMHKSTFCKIYALKTIFEKATKNKLKTETHNFAYFLTEIFEKKIVRIISTICTFVTFIGIVREIILFITNMK